MISQRKKRVVEEVNSSSMADIAFLLLIFFLVVTSFKKDEVGITTLLPPKLEDQEITKVAENNLLIVLLNSENKLLVDQVDGNYETLKSTVKEFIDNPERNPKLADSPKDAVVSLRVDRGTDFRYYQLALDAIEAAYTELRAEYLNISVDAYNRLDKNDLRELKMLNEVKREIPHQLSEAEPSSFGDY